MAQGLAGHLSAGGAIVLCIGCFVHSIIFLPFLSYYTVFTSALEFPFFFPVPFLALLCRD